MKEFYKQVLNFIKLAAAGALACLILISFFFSIMYFLEEYDDCDSDEDYAYEADEDEEDWECNVSGIELRGELATYVYDNGETIMTASENIYFTIEDAENDPQVKAILLEVDSYGGYPVAGEEVALALRRAQKPTVALIREIGTSAAYMAASGADMIFASRLSDVGSIGVSMSYLDRSRQIQRDGLDYVSLSSGIFKDTGTADKSLSAAERALLMRDVNLAHRFFVESVAQNRNLEVAAVERLADGSTMMGEMALDNGLIDRIGGLHEVEEYLKELLGEEVIICW